VVDLFYLNFATVFEITVHFTNIQKLASNLTSDLCSTFHLIYTFTTIGYKTTVSFVECIGPVWIWLLLTIAIFLILFWRRQA